MTHRHISRALASLFVAALPLSAVHAQGIVLKASHQFPGGKGDVRDEMVQIIAREVAAAKVGLEIKVYPGASLVKAQEQWKAMQTGQIDMTSFPLDYASGSHPQFGATLMPGLVKNHDHASSKGSTRRFTSLIRAGTPRSLWALGMRLALHLHLAATWNCLRR